MKRWYEIHAEAGNVEVTIFDEIGLWGITAEDFKREFDAAARGANSILVSINSPGGDVFDGVAMYNTIAKARDKVTIEVIGVAASIASIIALAGSKMKMGEASFFMIHNPWSLAIGTAEDLRQRAATLDAIRDEMVDIYQAHSELDRDEIIAAMDEETWYNPDQAYQAGFAQEIVVPEEQDIAALAFNWRAYNYRHVPTPAWEARRRAATPKTKREFEESLVALGFSNKQAERISAQGYEAMQGDPAAAGSQGDPGDVAKGFRELAKLYSEGGSNGS